MICFLSFPKWASYQVRTDSDQCKSSCQITGCVWLHIEQSSYKSLKQDILSAECTLSHVNMWISCRESKHLSEEKLWSSSLPPSHTVSTQKVMMTHFSNGKSLKFQLIFKSVFHTVLEASGFYLSNSVSIICIMKQSANLHIRQITAFPHSIIHYRLIWNSINWLRVITEQREGQTISQWFIYL